MNDLAIKTKSAARDALLNLQSCRNEGDFKSTIKKVVKSLLDTCESLEMDLVLCSTGRKFEQEVLCKLTVVISEVSGTLLLSANAGNQSAKAEFDKLNKITMELWGVPANDCRCFMPGLQTDVSNDKNR